MRVTCPKCDATIDITVTDLRPTSFRWRTNDFPLIEGLCLEWRDLANAVAKAAHSCSALDAAVHTAVVPKARGGLR